MHCTVQVLGANGAKIKWALFGHSESPPSIDPFYDGTWKAELGVTTKIARGMSGGTFAGCICTILRGNFIFAIYPRPIGLKQARITKINCYRKMPLTELSPKHESRMKKSSIEVSRMTTPCNP
jgi:hypothetical protein